MTNTANAVRSMTIRELLAARISPILKENGFKKEKLNWRRDAGNSIQVLNIQGSQWSSSLYINFGVYLKELGDKIKPTEAACHARARLEDIVPVEMRASVIDDKEISMFQAGQKIERKQLNDVEPFLERQFKLIKSFGLPNLLLATPNFDGWWLTSEMKKILKEKKK